VAATVAAMRALTSTLSSRMHVANEAGLTFAGQRNVREALGYLKEIGYQDYLDRFQRDGIARKVVSTYPKATWRGGWQLVEDDDPDIITEFEQGWLDLESRLKVSSVFRRADILAGVGQYAVVLIGTSGASKLDQELPRLKGPGDIIYLTVYGEGDAPVQSWEDDPRNERYALPKYYTLGRSGKHGALPRQVAQRRVHHSRTLHLAEELLDDEVYAAPKLRAVWDRLDDHVKVVGGGSEAYWLRAHQGLFLKVEDAEEQLPGGGTQYIPPSEAELEALRNSAEELANQMRRTMAARGVDVKPLGSDVADFSRPLDAIETVIAAISEIPKRVLFGTERGELASTQDRHSFESRVQDRRLSYAAPQVIRPFTDRLIKHGGLPEPVQYDIWWPEVMELSEQERAEVLLKYAQANRANPDGPVMSIDELRDRILDLPPLDEEVLEEQVEETGLPQEALRGLMRSKQVMRLMSGRGNRGSTQLRTAARGTKKKSRLGTPLSIVQQTGARRSSGE